jgi:nitrogen fixation NifU-like protein
MDNDLYQEVLLQYARRPKNYGPLEAHTHAADGFNTLCGDEISVALKMENGLVSEAKFTVSSCAVCTASACIMTGEVKGKSIEEIGELAGSFRVIACGGGDAGDLPEKLNVLERVSQFPLRVKCAVFPWETMVSALGKPVAPAVPES